MKTNKIYLSAAILSLLATSAIAQETFELDDIIISGGFTPIPLADSASSVSVITSEQISEAGDIEISQKWNPGKYLLRAYTNDMRNNSEEYFFKKDIWIWSSQKFVESNDSAYSTINENKATI